MRLLFIKFKHIGDALLLTPTLTAARATYPDAEIWVAVRHGTEGILAGCPAVDHVVTCAAPEAGRRSWGELGRELRELRTIRRARMDYAFDLTHADRGRLWAALSGARHRCADGRIYPPRQPWRWGINRLSPVDWSQIHRAEADWEVVNACLPLTGGRAGPLVFTPARTEPCVFTGSQALAVLHPATRWQRKRWLVERWQALARALQAAGLQVLISVGPSADEVAEGEAIARAVPGAQSTAGRLTWAQLAGLLHQARLFVGVDTAAMHLAAACGCPTVALFHSRAQARVWAPWRVPAEVVLPDGVATEERMELIPLAAVRAAAERMLAGGRSARAEAPFRP